MLFVSLLHEVILNILKELFTQKLQLSLLILCFFPTTQKRCFACFFPPSNYDEQGLKSEASKSTLEVKMKIVYEYWSKFWPLSDRKLYMTLEVTSWFLFEAWTFWSSFVVCGRNNIQNVSFLWSTEESKSNGFGVWLNDDRLLLLLFL